MMAGPSHVANRSTSGYGVDHLDPSGTMAQWCRGWRMPEHRPRRAGQGLFRRQAALEDQTFADPTQMPSRSAAFIRLIISQGALRRPLLPARSGRKTHQIVEDISPPTGHLAPVSGRVALIVFAAPPSTGPHPHAAPRREMRRGGRGMLGLGSAAIDIVFKKCAARHGFSRSASGH